MKSKFIIAVITPSRRRFEDFLRYTFVSDSIEFLHIRDINSIKGIHWWIGYIELSDAHDIEDLDKIRYNLNIRSIRPDNVKL